MPTLADIRQQYPQYKDLPDQALADGLYKKFYSDMPRADFDAKLGITRALPGPPTAKPREQSPVFDPTSSERGRAQLETITGQVGSDTGAADRIGQMLTQPDQSKLLAAQQDIEARLRAAGKTDEQIAADPEWQQSAKALSRGVSGAASATAIGETAGTAAMGAVGKGLVTAGKPIVNTVKNAIGTEAAEAGKRIAGEVKASVGNLIGEQQKAVATRDAMKEATAGREGAKVLEVSKPAAVDGSKVTQARATVRDLDRQLSDANTKLEAAKRNLSAADKYAGNKRSEGMVRMRRRDLNKAQAEFDRIKQQHGEAGDALKAIERENAEAAKAAKAGAKQEATSAKNIERQASQAQKKIVDLRGTVAELDAAKDPTQIAGIARKVGKQLHAAGKMTDAQYESYLSRVGSFVEKSKDTAQARERMVKLMKAAGLLGIGAAAESYAIRTFH